MVFRNYDKIHRLGKEETDGILDAPVHVQEKIDGANLQVWLEDDVIHVGSRNMDVTFRGDGFNGAVEHIQNHPGIKQMLEDHPTFRLYGEWLVKHTVQYRETSYGKFYLFDIHDGTGYLPTEEVDAFASEYELEKPHYYGLMTVTDIEQLKSLVGKSMLGDKGEGVVVKRIDFRNTFGDVVYAKLVSNEFMEDNSIVFGGNNKFSKTYCELWAVNKYMTLGRIKKIMSKIQSETDERLDMKHIPRICNTAYHDLLVEEIWDIAQKIPAGVLFDFNAFKRLSFKKAKQIYVDVLNDSISVADING